MMPTMNATSVLFENWNRYYFPDTGRYLSPEPMLVRPDFQLAMARAGMQVPSYAYANSNPLRFFDPTGLDIAVIENGPTSGNPVGHTAIAITGEGVFSFGNDTPMGSSFSDYIAREAPRRTTIVEVIKTTPAQDKAAAAKLRTYKKSLGVATDNCSSRSNSALDAAGIRAGNPLTNIPGTAGARASAAGSQAYAFPQQDIYTPPIPAALRQFEPAAPAP